MCDRKKARKTLQAAHFAQPASRLVPACTPSVGVQGSARVVSGGGEGVADGCAQAVRISFVGRDDAQPVFAAGVHDHQHLAAGNESLAAELARRQHAVRR